MNAAAITHRPLSLAAAVAAVAAAAIVGVGAVIASQNDTTPSVPSHGSQVLPSAPQVQQHWHATTSGGKVRMGQ